MPQVRGDLGTMFAPLRLTPQEMSLYNHHLTNLYGNGKVIQPTGQISTVLQMVVERDGKYYNIPSVWNGKILNEKQAIQKAASVGWQKWPSYPTPTEADRRYMDMHQIMESDVEKYLTQGQ